MNDFELWLGLAIALAAAASFETSYALQALEARAAPAASAMRVSLLLGLLRRPRWVLAIGLALFGMGLQVVALGLAPLTVVQPAIASGLLLLLYLGHRLLGESITPAQMAAAAAIVIGVAGIALAAPRRAESVEGTLQLTLVLGCLAAITIAPYALRALIGVQGVLLIVSAGAADAFAVFGAKLVSDELATGSVIAAIGWAVAGGTALLVGLVSETTALQRIAVTRVAPVILVIQTVVPVVLAPVVVGESWGDTPLGGGVIVASLALVAVATVVLASSRAVSDLLEAKDSGPAAGADPVEHQPGG